MGQGGASRLFSVQFLSAHRCASELMIALRQTWEQKFHEQRESKLNRAHAVHRKGDVLIKNKASVFAFDTSRDL